MDKDIRYYRYMGYRDGSGKPKGYVIKCYTKEEYEYYTKRCGHVLVAWPADGRHIDNIYTILAMA